MEVLDRDLTRDRRRPPARPPLGLEHGLGAEGRSEYPARPRPRGKVRPGRSQAEGPALPGSYLPGVIAAGTYRWPGNKEFWNVRRLNKAIVLHLQNEGYTRLVLEVADPAATVAAINDAVARIKPASSV